MGLLLIWLTLPSIKNHVTLTLLLLGRRMTICKFLRAMVIQVIPRLYQCISSLVTVRSQFLKITLININHIKLRLILSVINNARLVLMPIIANTILLLLIYQFIQPHMKKVCAMSFCNCCTCYILHPHKQSVLI